MSKISNLPEHVANYRSAIGELLVEASTDNDYTFCASTVWTLYKALKPYL